MSHKGLTALALSALVIVAVGTGCGGGNSGASLTKAEFIRRANVICAKAGKEVHSEFLAYAKTLEGKEPKTRSGITAAQKKVAETIVIPVKQKEVEQLSKLDAPVGDSDRIATVLNAIEQGIEKAQAEPVLATTNAEEVFGASEKIARNYGLDDC